MKGIASVSSGGKTDLLKEDVLVEWKPGVVFPIELLRLLPAWSTIRISAEQDFTELSLNEEKGNEA